MYGRGMHKCGGRDEEYMCNLKYTTDTEDTENTITNCTLYEKDAYQGVAVLQLPLEAFSDTTHKKKNIIFYITKPQDDDIVTPTKKTNLHLY